MRDAAVVGSQTCHAYQKSERPTKLAKERLFLTGQFDYVREIEGRGEGRQVVGSIRIACGSFLFVFSPLRNS